jgi:hypothetical protein
LVHAVTADGTLVIASASGSQLASYVWGAANVIFVVGAAYGQHSQVAKILEIHQELPGRIHLVLIRQQVGF